MCGLTGASGTHLDHNAIKIMMIDNEERGTHSSGMAMYRDGDPNYFIKKSTKKASLFVYDKSITKRLMTANEVIGHTRFATMGSHSEEHAHPYYFGNGGKGKVPVIGTHNGWLLACNRITAKDDEVHSFESFCEKKDYKVPEVDSMLVYKHLFETQSLTSIGDIEGAMALAFIMKGSLHLYRRESKPLYTYRTDGNIYYSSRKESFVKAFGVDENSNKITLLPANFVYIYKNGVYLKRVEIEKPKISIPLDETPMSFYYTFNSRNYKRNVNVGSEHRVHVGGFGRGIYDDEYSEEYYRRGNHFPQHHSRQPESVVASGTNSRVGMNNILPFFNDDIKDNIPARSSVMNVFNIALNDETSFQCLDYKIEKLKGHVALNDKKLMAGQSIMILTLVDNEGDPCVGYRVSLEGEPFSYYETKKTGKCGISIPKNLIKRGSVKIFVHPPADLIYGSGDDMLYPAHVYSLDVKVFDMQVLEIACIVPFLYEEKTHFLPFSRKVAKSVPIDSKYHSNSSIEKYSNRNVQNDESPFFEEGDEEKDGDDESRIDPYLKAPVPFSDLTPDIMEDWYSFPADYSDLKDELCLCSDNALDSLSVDKAIQSVIKFISKNKNKDITKYFVKDLSSLYSFSVNKMISNPGRRTVISKEFLSDAYELMEGGHNDVEKYSDSLYQFLNDTNWGIFLTHEEKD